MEKLIEFCQAKYKDELGFRFSLSNLFTIILFISCIYLRSTPENQALISGLNSIKIKTLIDMEDGIIPSLTLMQSIYSVAFMILIVWLSRKLSEGLFYLFSLKSDFQKTIIDITITYSASQENAAAKKELGISGKSTLERNQKKSNRTRGLAEIFLTTGTANLILFDQNLSNFAISIINITIYLAITWKSFHFFISDILPYYVAIKYSNNELTDLRSSFNDSQKSN